MNYCEISLITAKKVENQNKVTFIRSTQEV